MHLSLKLATVGALLFLTCPVAAQNVSQELITPESSANIFVFRDHAEPLIFTPAVKIDGQKIAGLAQKRFTAFRASPGEHVISISWPFLSRQGSAEITISILDDGKPHYLEVVGTSRVTGFLGNAYAIRIASGIGEVDPIQGAAKMRECCKLVTSR